jgi:hypothetical protein
MTTLLRLAVVGCSVLFVVCGPRDTLAQPVSSSGRVLALVRVGYYLNDREHDPERHCKLFFMVDGQLVTPKLVAGYMYWYPLPAEPRERRQQQVALRCDSYVLSAYVPENYDVYDGTVAIVLDAHTKLAQLLESDKYERFPIPFDQHYELWGSHSEGRFAAATHYSELPAAVRKALKGIYHFNITGCCDGQNHWFHGYR